MKTNDKPTCGSCITPYLISNGKCTYHLWCKTENKTVLADVYDETCKEKNGHKAKTQLQPGPEPKRKIWPGPSRIQKGLKSDFETVIP